MQSAIGEMNQLWEERLLRSKAEQIATYEDHLSELELTEEAEHASGRGLALRVEWRSRSHTVVIAFADRPGAKDADLATHATLLRPLRATGDLVLVEQRTGSVLARHALVAA